MGFLCEPNHTAVTKTGGLRAQCERMVLEEFPDQLIGIDGEGGPSVERSSAALSHPIVDQYGLIQSVSVPARVHPVLFT